MFPMRRFPLLSITMRQWQEFRLVRVYYHSSVVAMIHSFRCGCMLQGVSYLDSYLSDPVQSSLAMEDLLVGVILNSHFHFQLLS